MNVDDTLTDIRVRLAKINANQGALAEEADMHESNMSKIMNQKISPTAVTLERIFDALCRLEAKALG